MIRMTTTKVEFDLDKIEINRFLFKEFHFDVHEKLIEESEYDRNGKLEVRTLYRYNSLGLVSEQIYYDSWNELIERHQFFFDDNGLLLKSEVEYSNGSKFIKTYSFTALGQADEVIITDENDMFQGREVYHFGASGQKLEAIEMDESNIEVLRHTMKYNDDQNLIDECIYRNSILENQHVYEYDMSGNLSLSRSYDGAGKLLQSTNHIYNISGQLVEVRVNNPSNSTEMIEKYEYDAEGNQILGTARIDGKLVFHNTCTFQNKKIISEEIFEMALYKGIATHHKLIHEHFEGERQSD